MTLVDSFRGGRPESSSVASRPMVRPFFLVAEATHLRVGGKPREQGSRTGYALQWGSPIGPLSSNQASPPDTPITIITPSNTTEV